MCADRAVDRGNRRGRVRSDSRDDQGWHRVRGAQSFSAVGIGAVRLSSFSVFPSWSVGMKTTKLSASCSTRNIVLLWPACPGSW